MSLLQKALDTLAKAKGDIQSELEKHEAELTRLRNERAVTERLPVPKAEFLQRVDEAVDLQREDYEAALHVLLQPLTKPGPVRMTVNPLGLVPLSMLNGVPAPFERPDRGTVNTFSLQGLLADVIGDAIRKAIARMPYPAEVGLPQVEREKRLAEIDKETFAVEAKIAKLRDQIHQAGIRL